MAASRALLSESVVLALAGGAVGVALAQASTGLLRAIAPAELPRVDEIGIDVMVLLFTVSVSVLSGALFGLFAVLRFGSPSNMTLKEGGRPASDAPGRRHRARNALVVGQVALALTLLIVSGLMIRTFVAMRQVDPGFTRPAEVQTFVIAIPPGLISDPHTRRARTNASRNDSLECQASRRRSLVLHHDGRLMKKLQIFGSGCTKSWRLTDHTEQAAKASAWSTRSRRSPASTTSSHSASWRRRRWWSMVRSRSPACADGRGSQGIARLTV